MTRVALGSLIFLLQIFHFQCEKEKLYIFQNEIKVSLFERDIVFRVTDILYNYKGNLIFRDVGMFAKIL